MTVVLLIGIPAGSSTSDLRDLRTYLTRPDRFPRLLLAAVTTTAGDLEPEVYLLLFTGRAPQTPWKLSWQAKYADNTPLPAVRVDADGFAVLLTATQQRATLRTDTARSGGGSRTTGGRPRRPPHLPGRATSPTPRTPMARPRPCRPTSGAPS
jgi:hypothetical protein